ncbi:MAG: DNA translocase FtsK [candidate division WOR-3 bacterium]
MKGWVILILFVIIWILYGFTRKDGFVRKVSPFVGILLSLIYTFSKNPYIVALRDMVGPAPVIPFIWMVLDPFYATHQLVIVSSFLFVWGAYLLLMGKSIVWGSVLIFLSPIPLMGFLAPLMRGEKKEEEKLNSENKLEAKIETKKEDKVDVVDEKEAVMETEEGFVSLVQKLLEFGIRGRIVNISKGPVLTVYEFEPAPGVRVQSISKLEDDLYVRLKKPVRIVAPLPNGNIGFEIPNDERIFYNLKDFEGEIFKGYPLEVPIGVDVLGNPFRFNISLAPHTLIGGATGSGKSILLTTIISALIKKNSPEDLNLILIDPKRVELSIFEGLPHLVLPVAKTVKEASFALKTAVNIMDERYAMMSAIGARDIESFNSKVDRFDMEKMPYLVIVIDELADLMMLSPKETAESIQRIAQLARAVGIHMIVATQRPSVDVITGVIKANFPTRIALKVASRFDSRTILDTEGAERLLGKGDMLVLLSDRAEPVRVHGFYTSHSYAEGIILDYASRKLSQMWSVDTEHLKKFLKIAREEGVFSAIFRDDEPAYAERVERLCHLAEEILRIPDESFKNLINETLENYYPYRFIPDEEEGQAYTGGIRKVDRKILDAAKICEEVGYGSASMIQRRLGVGFPRAAKIVDQLEKLGFLSPPEGPKPRRILMSVEELEKKLKELGLR